MATAAGKRGRTVRAAVVAAIQAAETAGRLKAWHEPHAAVAIKLAAALGRPKLPTAELVRLSSELDKALNRLPLAEVTRPERGDGGDGSPAAGGAGVVDPRAPGLALVVGAGPEVGDTALPG